MKKIILSIVAVATLSINSFGQAPEGFKYQAVVRNASNTILINQAVGLRMTIKQGSIVGTTVYSESFASTTSANGLVNVEIGNGTPISGTFANIDWANGPFFIETAIDATGGSNYIVMGTSQLMSVPYALYAKTSGNGQGPVGPAGAQGIQGLPGTNGSVGSVTAISGTSNANGAFISAGDLTLTPADGSNGGVVTTDAQTFAGSKTFLSDLNVNGATFGLGGGSIISNTAAGMNALSLNISGDRNTALGESAMSSNISGGMNTAVGQGALQNNISGGMNTGIGVYALAYNDGADNNAIGTYALWHNTTGNGNTANGRGALNDNTTGSNNTSDGLEALLTNISGSDNTAVGRQTLVSNVTGNNNTAIGSGSNVASDNLNNATAIGSGAIVDADNKIQLGNSSVTNVSTNGNITAGAVTYPNTDGTSGQVLGTNGSGALSWVNQTQAQNIEQVLTVGNDANGKDLVNTGKIAIGTATPNAQASMEIATALPVIFPQMTQTQVNALTPVEGMVQFNKDAHKLQVYAMLTDNAEVFNEIYSGSSLTDEFCIDQLFSSPIDGQIVAIELLLKDGIHGPGPHNIDFLGASFETFTIPSFSEFTWFTFNLANPISVNAGGTTSFTLCMASRNTFATNNNYPNGRCPQAGVSTPSAQDDLVFRIHIQPNPGSFGWQNMH